MYTVQFHNLRNLSFENSINRRRSASRNPECTQCLQHSAVALGQFLFGVLKVVDFKSVWLANFIAYTRHVHVCMDVCAGVELHMRLVITELWLSDEVCNANLHILHIHKKIEAVHVCSGLPIVLESECKILQKYI